MALAKRFIHSLYHAPLKTGSEGISPFISGRTVDLLRSIQSENIQRLNRLTVGTELSSLNLYQLLSRIHQDASRALLQHLAGQAWNIEFFLNGLTGQPQEPHSALLKTMERDLGCLERMQEEFEDSALAMIASGWTWLVRKKDGHLAIINTYNGGTPLFINMRSSLEQSSSTLQGDLGKDNESNTSDSFADLFHLPNGPNHNAQPQTKDKVVDQNVSPVLGLSMWEHSYLLDYGLDRRQYVKNFWRSVNWNRAAIILNLY